MSAGASGEDGRAPLIITVAPNGARKTKADHPALPIAPEELAETAARCQAAGAAMIHLHVRDAEGGHSLDPDTYRAAIEAIEARLGGEILIQATTEAAGRYQPTEQMAAMRALKPAALSLAVRELLPDGEDTAQGAAFLREMHAGGTLIQYILYDAEDVRRFERLRGEGVIPEARPAVLFVLGRYRVGSVSTPDDLLPFLAAAREGEGYRGRWMVCAFGPLEAACGLTAAGLGGHVRVGFENNLLLADGTRAPDNAALVRQVAEAAHLMGRPLADAAAARRMLAA